MPDLSLQQRFALITAPDVLPISVGFAKKHMRVEYSDNDSLIARSINVAVNVVDFRDTLEQATITQTWLEWLALNPSVVYLSLWLVQSVSAVKYYDTNNALKTATLSVFHVYRWRCVIHLFAINFHVIVARDRYCFIGEKGAEGTARKNTIWTFGS